MIAAVALAVAVAAFLLAAGTFAMVWWLTRPIDDESPWERECKDKE